MVSKINVARTYKLSVFNEIHIIQILKLPPKALMAPCFQRNRYVAASAVTGKYTHTHAQNDYLPLAYIRAEAER